jgi:hypothetical protein
LDLKFDVLGLYQITESFLSIFNLFQLYQLFEGYGMAYFLNFLAEWTGVLFIGLFELSQTSHAGKVSIVADYHGNVLVGIILLEANLTLEFEDFLDVHSLLL